jgi:hypothetical protein
MIENKQQSKFEKALHSLRNFLFLKDFESSKTQKLVNKIIEKDSWNKDGFICYFDDNLDLVNIYFSKLTSDKTIWNIPSQYYYFIIEGDIFNSLLELFKKRVNYYTQKNLTDSELKKIDDKMNLLLNSDLKSYLDDEVGYFVSQINHSIGVTPYNTNRFVISSNFLTPDLVKQTISKLKESEELLETFQPDFTKETRFEEVQQTSLYSLFEKFNPAFITERERFVGEWVKSDGKKSYSLFSFINSIGPNLNCFHLLNKNVKEVKNKEKVLANLNPEFLKFWLLHLLFLKDETEKVETMNNSGVVDYLVTILQIFFDAKGLIAESNEEHWEQSELLESLINKNLDCEQYYLFGTVFSELELHSLTKSLIQEVTKTLESQVQELTFNIDVDKHLNPIKQLSESKLEFSGLIKLILNQTNLKVKICFYDLKSYFTETDSEGEVISYHLRDFTNLHEEFGERVSFKAQPIDVEALEYYKLGAEKGFIKKDSLGEINLLLPLLKQ